MNPPSSDILVSLISRTQFSELGLCTEVNLIKIPKYRCNFCISILTDNVLAKSEFGIRILRCGTMSRTQISRFLFVQNYRDRRWQRAYLCLEMFCSEMVLLRGIQLTFVQRIQQLHFVIHYCCDNTRKVRAPNAGGRSGVHTCIGLI
jgi:hypothetical protein